VAMNHLMSCDEYPILEAIFTQSWRWPCHVGFAEDWFNSTEPSTKWPYTFLTWCASKGMLYSLHCMGLHHNGMKTFILRPSTRQKMNHLMQTLITLP
jgi:hypothetical protein